MKQLLILVIIAVALLAGGWYFFGQSPADTDMSQSQPQVEDMNTLPDVMFGPGMYATMMPAASSPGRTISLELNADQTATFTQDYQNQNPPIVQTGTWSNIENMVTVTLETEVMEFIFEPMSAGVLMLQNADTAVWGEEGLVLQNAAPFMNTTWLWTDTLMSDGAQTMTDAAQSFSLVFSDLGSLSVTTDCNGGAGGYALMGMNMITIGPLAQTLMACEGSQETAFMTQLQSVNSYVLIDGNLHLLLPFDSGTMSFAPAIQ